MKNPGTTPYIWMIVGQMAFAIMAALAHGLKDYCSWQVIAVCRSTIPMFLVAFLAWWYRVKLVMIGSRALWIRSIAGSISLVCTFYAFTRLPVSDVLTITNLFPVWIAILSWPILGQRPTIVTGIAILSGFAGVVLIQQPHIAAGNLASFAALTSSVCSAIAMLGLHQLHELDSRAIVFHFSSVSLLFSFSAKTFITATNVPNVPWQLITFALLIGMGATATVGQICLTKAFTSGNPSRVAVVGLTQVGFGALIELAVWGRTFEWETLIGMSLILAPTAWLMLHGGPSASPPDE